jgi:hypothetical protein
VRATSRLSSVWALMGSDRLQLRSFLQPNDVVLLAIVAEKIPAASRKKKSSLIGLALISHASSGAVCPLPPIRSTYAMPSA